jgi:hypothetical protein
MAGARRGSIRVRAAARSARTTSLHPRPRVVSEEKSWPTHGPNVGRTIGSTMRSMASRGTKPPAKEHVHIRSSPGVGVLESACHAGGRGFESRRSNSICRVSLQLTTTRNPASRADPAPVTTRRPLAATHLTAFANTSARSPHSIRGAGTRTRITCPRDARPRNRRHSERVLCGGRPPLERRPRARPGAFWPASAPRRPRLPRSSRLGRGRRHFHAPGDEGLEINERVAPREGEAVISKEHPNSIRDTALDSSFVRPGRRVRRLRACARTRPCGRRSILASRRPLSTTPAQRATWSSEGRSCPRPRCRRPSSRRSETATRPSSRRTTW